MRSEVLARRAVRCGLGGGVLGAICVTVGAFAYAAMPTSGHVATFAPLQALRAWPAAQRSGLVLCVTGLVVWTVSWLLVGMGIRRQVVGVGALRTGAWLSALPLLVAPPLFSGDGWSYAADAFLAGHDLSPYRATPSLLQGPIVEAVCPCWLHARAPYGPLPLMWGGSFAHLTGSPWALMLSFRLLALMALALLLWAVPRLALMVGRNPAVACWLVSGPFVVAVGIGGTHLDLAMVAIAATALVLTPTHGWLAGSVLIGLASAVKAPAAIAALGVVLLAAPSGRLFSRAWCAVRVSAVVAGVVTGLGFLGGWGLGWIGALHATLALHTPLSLTYEARRFAGWVGTPHGLTLIDTIGIGSLVVALVVLLVRTPTGQLQPALRATAVAMLLTTVLSPVTNDWYFLWCVPLLGAVLISACTRGWLIGFVVAMGLIAPLDPSLHIPGTRALVIFGTLAGSVVGAIVGIVLGTRNASTGVQVTSGPGTHDAPLDVTPLGEVERA